MSVLSCLELVHRSPGRVRYRIHSSTPIPWVPLRQLLCNKLTGLPLGWRLNPAANSLVITYRSPADGLSDGADAAASTLRQAAQVLLVALASSGVTPPANAVIRIHVHNRPHVLVTPLRWLLNALSGGVSLALLALASLLLLLGALGLMLPLSPGGVLLLLAYGMIELALVLRRPFVNLAAT